VWDNVEIGLRSRGVSRADARPKVERALALVELEGYGERKVQALSGGQQQRVALARAVVRSPVAYLMDEPLSNLDAQLRVQTRAELKRLQQELGTTTLYVTHDQGEAMTMAGRVALLRQGVIEQLGPPLELYRRPANTFVATFLGSPAMNVWPGAPGPSGTVTAAGATLRVPDSLRNVLASSPGFEVGVRPEDVQVAPAPGPGRTEGRVVVVEPMGNETIVILESAGARVVGRSAADLETRPGAPIWFDVRPGQALFFDGASGQRLG